MQEIGFIWNHPYTVEVLTMGEEGKGFSVEALHERYKRFLGEPLSPDAYLERAGGL